MERGIFYRDSKKSNWFDEATATHFEKLPTSNRVTDNENKNYWRLWQGPIPKNSITEDGYARGLLIDYMSSKLGGDGWIRDCYENWSADFKRLKAYMKLIAPTEAEFAAKFYLEIVKSLGIHSAVGYYSACRTPIKDEGHDHYLSAFRLELDDKTKEKITKGKEDVLPIVFTGPSFELEGYGGRVVALMTKDSIKGKIVNLAESLPDKCQMKLEAEGCRLQIIRFNENANLVLSDTVIKDFKGQLNKGYRYLVLVTSTQPTKQNVVLKATLEKEEELKEGIYNGKTTMTQGSHSQTANNRVGFRLTQSKDGWWALNVCEANGDNFGTAPNVPLTYDSKQKIWKGHRKFKEDISRDPKKKKEEVSDINCTMKVNLEGKEPVLIVDYKIDVTRLWGDYSLRNMSFSIHFEGKWSGGLKGKTLKMGKVTILE